MRGASTSAIVTRHEDGFPAYGTGTVQFIEPAANVPRPRSENPPSMVPEPSTISIVASPRRTAPPGPCSNWPDTATVDPFTTHDETEPEPRPLESGAASIASPDECMATISTTTTATAAIPHAHHSGRVCRLGTLASRRFGALATRWGGASFDNLWIAASSRRLLARFRVSSGCLPCMVLPLNSGTGTGFDPGPFAPSASMSVPSVALAHYRLLGSPFNRSSPYKLWLVAGPLASAW